MTLSLQQYVQTAHSKDSLTWLSHISLLSVLVMQGFFQQFKKTAALLRIKTRGKIFAFSLNNSTIFLKHQDLLFIPKTESMFLSNYIL